MPSSLGRLAMFNSSLFLYLWWYSLIWCKTLLDVGNIIKLWFLWVALPTEVRHKRDKGKVKSLLLFIIVLSSRNQLFFFFKMTIRDSQKTVQVFKILEKIKDWVQVTTVNLTGTSIVLLYGTFTLSIINVWFLIQRMEIFILSWIIVKQVFEVSMLHFLDNQCFYISSTK